MRLGKRKLINDLTDQLERTKASVGSPSICHF